MAPQVIHVTLPGDQPPWSSTGLGVRAGDAVTLLGSGFIRWSPHRNVGAGPKYHLWGRVPGGEIFGSTQDTATVTIDVDGELELCVYKGRWADRTGTLATGEEPYRRNQGALHVTVLRWPAGTDPADALGRLDETWLHDARVDGRLVEAELHRLRHPVIPPAGWSPLLDFGPTDIYRASSVDGRPAIDVVCVNDAGIIRTPVDVPLDPSTELSWRWRVDELPSEVSEDTTWTHDYLSIAAEFDDGRDLTWFWSCCLTPVEDTFACPVRDWSHRETHMPLRRGAEGLGRFHHERRNVWDDHHRFMGEPPNRIVAVWLIAVSHFARSTGRATFADIAVHHARGTLTVSSPTLVSRDHE